jgi:hypothetical protein
MFTAHRCCKRSYESTRVMCRSLAGHVAPRPWLLSALACTALLQTCWLGQGSGGRRRLRQGAPLVPLPPPPTVPLLLPLPLRLADASLAKKEGWRNEEGATPAALTWTSAVLPTATLVASAARAWRRRQRRRCALRISSPRATQPSASSSPSPRRLTGRGTGSCSPPLTGLPLLPLLLAGSTPLRSHGSPLTPHLTPLLPLLRQRCTVRPVSTPSLPPAPAGRHRSSSRRWDWQTDSTAGLSMSSERSFTAH